MVTSPTTWFMRNRWDGAGHWQGRSLLLGRAFYLSELTLQGLDLLRETVGLRPPLEFTAGQFQYFLLTSSNLRRELLLWLLLWRLRPGKRRQCKSNEWQAFDEQRYLLRLDY